MKLPAKIGLGFLGVLALSQAIRPDHTNPPATVEVQAPPDVAKVLKRACYDCHSNQTTWPWYSQIAPVSWLVARDVNEGRRHLNFSYWDSYEPAKRAKKLEHVESEVKEGEMPMAIYVPLHPEAKLSEADKALLIGWAQQR
jgi:hypothetical protein